MIGMRSVSFSAARLRAAAILILIGTSCTPAFGQALTSVSSNVSDASGALASNVSITIEDKNRGFGRSVQIPPGTYLITAKAAGFAEVTIGPLQLLVNTPNERHSIQFRAEAFNLTNSVRFDPRSLSLSLTSVGSFGKYTGTLNSPRQMQFALRYEF
jgi:hypothetical protein